MGHGDRVVETWRGSERRRDGFCGAWRAFCESGGSGGYFAGLMATLHPLPKTVRLRFSMKMEWIVNIYFLPWQTHPLRSYLLQ